MRISKRTGIKFKITLAFSVIFILLSFALNIYSYRRIRQMIIADNDRYLLSRADVLLDKTEVNPVIIPLPDKNSAIRVLYRSGSKRHILFQSPGAIKNVSTPLAAGITDTLSMRIAYVVSDNDENPAELMLAVSNAPLNQNLRFLFRLLFVCSLISVLVAGLVSYLLAGLLLLPVQRIIDAANKITTNKLRDLIPVKNTNDELQELTETINNMLQRIDDSLQQQQNFFASASHELKTPLAILRAELEVELKKNDTTNRELLLSQLEEINRLQEVVQEFLLISQLKGTGLSIHYETFDLSALILKVFNRLLPLLKQKDLATAITFGQETAGFFIDGDEEKIRMVLVNLLENAVKYSVGHTTIYCDIRVTADSRLMQIAIRNSIAAESISTEKLPQPFYRADILEKGAGMGLWLCNEIIGAHRGSLLLESAGHIFCVSISLPLNAPAQ